MSSKKSTISIAAAAASLVVSSLAFAAETPQGAKGPAIAAGDKVHCYGLNSCKGKSDCKTLLSSCKAKNSCEGKGFKSVTAKKCLKKGGIISDIKT
ncbi:MAG: hypothetical protein OEZ58_17205 [Gammaproteobacteria bacterium]|nr:hypothetical protein [Gammaproteobacteria bacterium]MDH5730730.1 hypothetical protein [Gammaproteobacteria bacterium]